MNLYITLVALIIERFIAYPNALQSALRHPVEWMGSFIAWFDEKYNYGTETDCLKRGFFMLAILVFISLSVALLISYLASLLPFGWVIEAMIAFIFLAQRQLGQSVKAVSDGLALSLEKGRKAVAHIVGRDVKNLNEAEISRASIETLAENTSDGFIAPLFYLLIFGLPGIIIYKAINTADSMVGHKSERYRYFGFASAKLDDLVNFIPARLTALIFMLTAMLYKKANWREAVIAAFRDAHKHASPNAGWPEASMAGALGFGLGGKRSYNGSELDLLQMGNGKRDLTRSDIDLSLRFYDLMLRLVFFLIFVSALVFLIL